MPELAEVEFYRRQWDPGVGARVREILLHPKARIFRGIDTARLVRGLAESTLVASEARGKQMLFHFRGRGRGASSLWIGLHLGMTGALRAEGESFRPDRHDHLVLRQRGRTLVFRDPRLFGRVRFAESTGEQRPDFWTELPPDLRSRAFDLEALRSFLRRRGRSPIKAVLLDQERFPGIGNWMADEILWRAEIHPGLPAGRLDAERARRLHREIGFVVRGAMRHIAPAFRDPPRSWLFSHRWADGGRCPATGAALVRETIGGRTTCWSPGRQRDPRPRKRS